MVLLDRDCNRTKDKVVRDEWNLKNCNHLDIEDPPSVSREVREVIQVLIAPAHDGRKRRSRLGERLRFCSNCVHCPLAWKWVDADNGCSKLISSN